MEPPVAAVIIAAIVGPLLWKQQTTQPLPAAAAVEVAKIDMAPLPALASAALHRAGSDSSCEERETCRRTGGDRRDSKRCAGDGCQPDEGRNDAFLNGNWRVMVDVKDPVSGKAPSLRYQIQPIKALLAWFMVTTLFVVPRFSPVCTQSGELMIKSRGNARCTDGSRYPMPEITCKAGTNDVAACTARYDDHAEIPLTIKR